MSKRKHPTSSDIVNPTLSDSLTSRDRAIILKKKHDAWEKKQKFKVIILDNRTTIYRLIKSS